jgi:hypothetical protein
MADEPTSPPKKERRRLPVLQQSQAATEEEGERTPAQWMLIGGFATIVAWLLLAGSVNAVVQHAAPSAVVGLAVAQVVAYATACTLGGMLMGYAAKPTAPKHASIMASATALLAVGLSASGPSLPGIEFVLAAAGILCAVAWGFARLGFRLGRRLAP